VEVVLHHREIGVAIRYTVDGSVPDSSDTLYEGPIKLSEPTTLRARAFKSGFTKSITVQETFVFANKP
jgi:hypothetical protein